jgi:hypothetical protein
MNAQIVPSRFPAPNDVHNERAISADRVFKPAIVRIGWQNNNFQKFNWLCVQILIKTREWHFGEHFPMGARQFSPFVPNVDF